MTDLNSVYGDLGGMYDQMMQMEHMTNQKPPIEPIQKNQEPMYMPLPPPPSQPPSQPQPQDHQLPLPQPIVFAPSRPSYQSQPQAPPQPQYNHDLAFVQQQNMNTVTMIDKFSSKKKEVFKMLMYSLVIVIALGIHSACDVFLKRYITANDFPESKEYIVRALYPAIILGLMWTLKVFYK